MPIYEYHCEGCEKEFEELVRMGTPDEEIVCPSCGERRSRRLLSMFAGRSASGSTGISRGGCGGGSGFR